MRHAPQTVADLVMHKKKVDEIRGWLELQLQPGLHCKAPKVLVLTGEEHYLPIHLAAL